MAGVGDDHPWYPWHEDDGAAMEHAAWVPVRAHKLAYLSSNMAAVLQSRWLQRLLEHEWEEEAAAVEEENPDADRRLEMASRLRFLMSESDYSFSCMLRTIQDDFNAAVHPRRRPRPDSAAWWHWCGGYDRARFVRLSRGQVARARGLLADALSRTQRLRVPADDLQQICWGPPAVAAAAAGLHAALLLLGRLRHAQRLADAVLLPLHDLKSFVDRVIAANEPRRRGGRGRGGSAPPSSQRPDAAARPPQPMLRRTASM